MSHIVCLAKHVQQLVAAARCVQEQIDNGTITKAFGDGLDDHVHTAVCAFDTLAKAADVVSADQKIASPFLRYRREILADNELGAQLRQLAISLFSSGTAIGLRQLFETAGEQNARIVLECLAHFAAHGDRDSHFMSLSTEICQELSQEAA